MEVTTNATSQLAETTIQLLAPILLLLATYLVRKLVLVLETRLKVHVSRETEAQIDEWAHQAIDLAEEKAHQACKDGLKVTGAQKIELAADYVQDLIKKYELDKKLGEWPRTKVKDLIEARIPDSTSKTRPSNGIDITATPVD